MSQRVDLDEQQRYQAPSGEHGMLSQRQPGYPPLPGGMHMPIFVQPHTHTGESVSSRHQLILAICSLVALAVAVIAFASVLETWTATYMAVYALIGLGIVSVSIVAINFAFNLRR